ncbi:MAG: glycosyltransferase family 4 protein, partial [Candidatus Falkowbacteria bacterium]|nr:glycosyltransferase family 4 protein [Candidatus Falkowbacteria bacterium]
KKGFSDGLAAFKIAQDKFPHLELIIFGAYRPGPEVPKTARFYYHPTGKKLGALYQEADIFLWPSRLEGFGLPPLEAMASGAAVVMTNTGAASDYAINNENALIVPPGDINALSAALITLITQPEKRISLARAGEIKAREFSQEKSDRQLEKIILQV